jgi:hypothetical protein
MSKRNRKKNEQKDVVVLDDLEATEQDEQSSEEVAGTPEPVVGEESEEVAGSQPVLCEAATQGGAEDLVAGEDDESDDDAEDEASQSTGPGRPPGSANREYQTVTSHPTRCPSCGGTEFGSIPNAKLGEVKFCGTMPNGQRYTRTTRIRRKCRTCGQHVILVERHFNPDDWV